MGHLIVMRGLPGSGKSYLAEKLAEETGASIYSTDNWFTNGVGEYVFDGSKLGEAHEATQTAVGEAMARGESTIIVDDTNTRFWEMAPYFQLAGAYRYTVETRIPDTDWAWDVEVCSRRNTHGAPIEAIRRMAERFER